MAAASFMAVMLLILLTVRKRMLLMLFDALLMRARTFLAYLLRPCHVTMTFRLRYKIIARYAIQRHSASVAMP